MRQRRLRLIVMRIALGESGARWIALAITISALGFLSQSMLTAPRVYYAMARDGLFFASVGKVFGKSEAPVVAIVLQGFAAIVIACSGTYGEILNFEVTVDFIFFGMTAAALFILRRRRSDRTSVVYRVPGYPFTTMLFVLSCAELCTARSLLRLAIAQSRCASCWPASPRHVWIPLPYPLLEKRRNSRRARDS